MVRIYPPVLSFVLFCLTSAALLCFPAAGGDVTAAGPLHPKSLTAANRSSSLPLRGGQLDQSLPFPAYYINLEANDQLRRRMERAFGAVWELRRVPAQRKADVVSRHLRTIRHAYLQGEPFVFVTEDKISPLLMPLWTSSIRDLVLELHETGAEWHTLQLGWLVQKDRGIYQTADWTPEQRIASLPVQSGATAYVLSRAGMQAVVQAFFYAGEDDETEGTGKGKGKGEGKARIRYLPMDEEGRAPQIDEYLDRVGKSLLVLPSLFTVDAFENPATLLDWVEPERFSNHAHIDATMTLLHRLAGEPES